MQEEEQNCVIRLDEQRKLIAEWSDKLEKIKNLDEPETAKDLTDYIRAVEHFRMDFFTSEAKFEQVISDKFIAEKTNSSSVDISCFYGQIRSMLRLLIILIIALIFSGVLVSAAIWFSMNL